MLQLISKCGAINKDSEHLIKLCDVDLYECYMAINVGSLSAKTRRQFYAKPQRVLYVIEGVASSLLERYAVAVVDSY